jgi:hypothetical protein
MENYVIPAFVCIYLAAVAFTLIHIHRTRGIGYGKSGNYWAVGVVFAGMVTLFLYWTCRSWFENVYSRYYQWCQKQFKR